MSKSITETDDPSDGGAAGQSKTPLIAEKAIPTKESQRNEPHSTNSGNLQNPGLTPIVLQIHIVIDELVALGIVNPLHAYMAAKARLRHRLPGIQISPRYIRKLMKLRGFQI